MGMILIWTISTGAGSMTGVCPHHMSIASGSSSSSPWTLPSTFTNAMNSCRSSFASCAENCCRAMSAMHSDNSSWSCIHCSNVCTGTSSFCIAIVESTNSRRTFSFWRCIPLKGSYIRNSTRIFSSVVPIRNNATAQTYSSKSIRLSFFPSITENNRGRMCFRTYGSLVAFTWQFCNTAMQLNTKRKTEHTLICNRMFM